MQPHLVFAIEGENFGLPAQAVTEVLDAPHVRRLAGMPDHVAGVLLHRNTWLPAIDAAPRFNLMPRALREAAVVIRRGNGRYALMADAVLGIRVIDETASGVVTTDLGLVTPVDPNLLFQNDANLEEENPVMSAATANVSLVVFKMNGEDFATDISNVVEVLEYREPVHVPRAPDFVDGVIQVRDFVLPIIDLRKRMEIPRGEPTVHTRIMVVLMDNEHVGLLVDSVVEVAHITTEQVAAPPAFFRGVSAEYLQGLAQVGERLVIVLRLERILTSQERIALLRADLTPADLEEAELVPAGLPEPPKRSRRKH